MKKLRINIIAVIITMLFFAVCTPLTTVNDKAVQSLRKDLMGIASSIKTVNVTTWGPGGTIYVYFSDNPSQEITDAVVERVKDFAQGDTLQSFNQKEHLDLLLYIYTNGQKEKPSIGYSSTYYNSGDTTDQSPSNVNGYKSWKFCTSPLSDGEHNWETYTSPPK